MVVVVSGSSVGPERRTVFRHNTYHISIGTPFEVRTMTDTTRRKRARSAPHTAAGTEGAE